MDKSTFAQEFQAAPRPPQTAEKGLDWMQTLEEHSAWTEGAPDNLDQMQQGNAHSAGLASCQASGRRGPGWFHASARWQWRWRTVSFPATIALLFLGLSGDACLFSQTGGLQAAPQAVLARHYQEGEKIGYTISSLNHSRSETNEYEARAEGVASKDQAGVFAESFAWTDLQLNDRQVRLSAASSAFREPLSLAPGAKLAIPDLGRVQPGLIAPITDLLTFYADTKIAMNQKGLMRAGDHAYVSFAKPSSWADGTKVIVGEDSVDFAVMLQSLDQAAQVATLVVRHVPPEQPQLKLPARWMSAPVGASQNNWVQVEKTSDGKYRAGVGQETFDVEIKVSLATGRILSATLDNPVDVMERVCSDAALTACGDPERYSIRRQITLRADPTPAQGPSK